MLRRLNASYDRLIEALALLAALSIGCMCVWVTYEVVMRYLFTRPTIWAVDLSEYTLLWSTFLAAPWVLKREGHVTIDLLVNALGPTSRQRLGIVVSLIGAAICAIFAWSTAFSVIEYYLWEIKQYIPYIAIQRELIIRHLWEIKQYIPYIAIPVGGTLLTIEFLRRAYRYATGTQAGLKPDEAPVRKAFG